LGSQPRERRLCCAFDRQEQGEAGGERRLEQYLVGVGSAATLERYDRVVERRRAVAVACHLREFEELSIAQIAERLGRSPATIKAYF